MRTNYQQGYAFENRIVKKLNALGGLAYRTAGSHSPIDITYHSPNGETVLIQCKHSRKKAIDIRSLLCDTNTIKLERLTVSETVRKLLLIKQPSSRDVIQIVFDERWKLANILDLS